MLRWVLRVLRGLILVNTASNLGKQESLATARVACQVSQAGRELAGLIAVTPEHLRRLLKELQA
ncbi:MAG: hypothetical protein DMG08_17230 [Acidobacteria bacterium]|nr:MAG: hypothetical protein DMG08_17230 [Acidobacteriota bacterium]